MKIFAIFLIIFAVLSATIASSVYTKDFSNPAHPGKCVIDDDLILSPGRHKHPTNKCISYECTEKGFATVFISSPEGCE